MIFNIKLTPAQINFIKSLCAAIILIITPSALIIASNPNIVTTRSYHVAIEEDLCISCGTCEGEAPDCFIVTDKAYVLSSYENCGGRDCVAALRACPTGAISIN